MFENVLTELQVAQLLIEDTKLKQRLNNARRAFKRGRKALDQRYEKAPALSNLEVCRLDFEAVLEIARELGVEFELKGR